MIPKWRHDEPLPCFEFSLSRISRVHSRGDQPPDSSGDVLILNTPNVVSRLLAQSLHRIAQRLTNAGIEVPMHATDHPGIRNESSEVLQDCQVRA